MDKGIGWLVGMRVISCFVCTYNPVSMIGSSMITGPQYWAIKCTHRMMSKHLDHICLHVYADNELYYDNNMLQCTMFLYIVPSTIYSVYMYSVIYLFVCKALTGRTTATQALKITCVGFRYAYQKVWVPRQTNEHSIHACTSSRLTWSGGHRKTIAELIIVIHTIRTLT